MSEYRVRFGHCVRSFISTTIHESVSAKRITISGSMFLDLIHFLSASTNSVHLLQIPLWVHWYMWCIISGVTPHHGQRLIVACPCCCIIVMVGRVLLMYFMMKCSMWKVVVSCACLNDVRSISPHPAV